MSGAPDAIQSKLSFITASGRALAVMQCQIILVRLGTAPDLAAMLAFAAINGGIGHG